MNKNHVNIRINGKNILGIMLQKSKIVLDFKLHISELDDTLKALRDISKVGSWTNGKSRLNVYDEDMLQYGVRITKQCYNHYAMKSHDLSNLKTNATEVEKNSRNIGILVESKKRFVDHIEGVKATKTNNAEKKEGRSDIESIVCEMINEYSTNSTFINKELRQRLTREYVESGSMKTIVKKNSALSKERIKRHVRTSMRLPEKLRDMENGGQLHSSPDCSLQIALFATNRYDWDGNEKDKDVVISCARVISEYLSKNKEIDAVFRAKKPMPDANQNHRIDDETRYLPSGGQDIPAAIAVWIAVATLHRKYGINAVFSNKEIITKISQQKLCRVSYNTIAAHVSSHCVANAKANSSNVHRKTYRTSSGMYRLYRRGEPCHPTRRNCKIAPLPYELPEGYKNLRGWYDDRYCSM